MTFRGLTYDSAQRTLTLTLSEPTSGNLRVFHKNVLLAEVLSNWPMLTFVATNVPDPFECDLVFFAYSINGPLVMRFNADTVEPQ